MEIVLKDEDRCIDYTLSVEPYNDDAGRYVEPNEVKLESGVVWIGKHGYTFMPETNIQAKDAGAILAAKFAGEIDEAVRSHIAKLLEVA